MVKADEIRSREVFDPLEGVPVVVRFRAISLVDPATGQEVVLSGPVDLTRYDAVVHRFTNPRTGLQDSRPGFRLWVSEVDGVAVDKPWNLLATRAIERVKPELRSGHLFTGRWRILATEPAPRTQYSIVALPETTP